MNLAPFRARRSAFPPGAHLAHPHENAHESKEDRDPHKAIPDLVTGGCLKRHGARQLIGEEGAAPKSQNKATDHAAGGAGKRSRGVGRPGLAGIGLQVLAKSV